MADSDVIKVIFAQTNKTITDRYLRTKVRVIVKH